MKTILELDVTPKERDVLLNLLQMMNISFTSRDRSEAETAAFQAGASSVFVAQAVEDVLGIWKNRTDFEDFSDFRHQAWGGRGAK